jgi:hypothetical protein
LGSLQPWFLETEHQLLKDDGMLPAVVPNARILLDERLQAEEQNNYTVFYLSELKIIKNL